MPLPDPSNRYTRMQLKYYELDAEQGIMLQGNHEGHNRNPDYWTHLVGMTEGGSFSGKTGLDFGCGTARNVLNLIDRFARFDGVDISPGLVAQAEKRVRDAGYGPERSQLHACDGVSLSVLPDGFYDFVMSTIVLQHIPVHAIRRGYLEEFHRVMRSGGTLSIQVLVAATGFDRGPTHARYLDDCWDAAETNGGHDCVLDRPAEMADELNAIGFVDVQPVRRPGWGTGPMVDWLYVKATRA